MEKEKMELFLQSMTYGTEYKFLEEAKDKDELTEVAKRHGIVWPTRDLSILKGMYAYVDKENLNGCTLPKAEAEKALPTLKGKAVDFDHLRKSVVGHYLEGQIVGDQIITYAVFYKANFEEEFDLISDLFNEGNLKISFEAWGNKVEKGNGKYNLTEIEFAGGALLINTKPAAGEKAEVLEMAKSNSKVLEFASVMTAPKHFVKNKADSKEIANEKKALEVARYTIYDMQFIMRLIDEIQNPDDKEDHGYHDILSVNFVEGIVKTQWISFDEDDKNGFFTIYLTPRVESGSNKDRKIVEIKKEDKINNSSNSKKDDEINKNNVSEDTRKMEELKKLQDELAVIKAAKETSDAEIASLKEKLATAEAKVTEVEAKLVEAQTLATAKETALTEAQTKAEAEKAEAIVKAKEEATKLTLRKAELGEEFAKDMKDEDILNDDKFENAKLKKEVAELKAKTPVKASVNTGKKTEIVVGSKDTESEITKAQKRVTEMAFAKDAVAQ